MKTTSYKDISNKSSGIEAVSDKTIPFWLGNDSLMRAAVAPDVKTPATLLLVEHFLFGAGSAPSATLGLLLLAFLLDGHLGKDGNLALYWVCS